MIKNSTKILFCCVAIGIVVLLIVFFRTNIKNSISRPASKKDKVTIGFCMDSLVIERWSKDRDIFVAKAKELGADVIVQKANNDTQEQIQQIRYLIDQNVDVLVIVPHDSDSLGEVVNLAKKKGIKVISYDRLIKNAGVDLYISFDNSKVGQLMAESLVKKAPEGNYIIINGGKEDYNTHFVNESFKNVLKPYIACGKIKIIDEVWSSGWKEEEAYNCVEKALSNGIKIDGIMGGNDRLAEAAIQALAEIRLAGEITVVGQDASLSGCQRVVEGTQYMTVYKPIQVLAQKAAEYAVELGKGNKINTNDKIFDGTYFIPFQVEEPIAVYKDNMIDTVIKDNFHNMEDIYINIPKSEWPKLK